MTRLTEALERARQVPAAGGTVTEPTAQKSRDEVLRTWKFDTEDTRPPASPLAVKMPEASTAAHYPDDRLDKLVVGDRSDPGLVEQYRRIAAALHHANAQRGVRSIMVGSAVAA